MTDEDWRIVLERLQGRLDVQSQKHDSHVAAVDARVTTLEQSVDKRLSKIEVNTNRLVWILVTFLIMSALSSLFGDRIELPRTIIPAEHAAR